MAGWLLICAGLLAAYGLVTWLERRRARARMRKADEEWLRAYNDERERRWKGAGWWQ